MEKTVEPWNFAESSYVMGSGYLSGIVALFTCLRSRQSRRPPVLSLRHYQVGVPRRSVHPFNDARIQEFVQLLRDKVTQGKGQPLQWLDDWSHSWISEWLVVEGGEATQSGEQGWPAVQPRCGHCQYGGTQVICNGEAQGTEQVETKEVCILARHLEGECWETPRAVTHNKGGSAHHANFTVCASAAGQGEGRPEAASCNVN